MVLKKSFEYKIRIWLEEEREFLFFKSEFLLCLLILKIKMKIEMKRFRGVVEAFFLMESFSYMFIEF